MSDNRPSAEGIAQFICGYRFITREWRTAQQHHCDVSYTMCGAGIGETLQALELLVRSGHLVARTDEFGARWFRERRAAISDGRAPSDSAREAGEE